MNYAIFYFHFLKFLPRFIFAKTFFAMLYFIFFYFLQTFVISNTKSVQNKYSKHFPYEPMRNRKGYNKSFLQFRLLSTQMLYIPEYLSYKSSNSNEGY